MSANEDFGKIDENDICSEIADGIYECPNGIFVESEVAVKDKEKSDEKKRKKEKGLLEEVSKAAYMTTRPVLTKEEAGWVERHFVTVFLGSITSGLSTAFGFYIYSIFGQGELQLLSDPFWNAIFFAVVFIVGIALLNFFQYRLTRSLEATEILEKFAISEDDTAEEN